MSSQMWDDRYSASELVWSSTPNEQVAKFASSLSPGNALDFGGGEGRNALWLVENGWEATVLDFSAVALERAQLLASQRFDPTQLARFHTVLLRTPLIWLWSPICSLLMSSGAAPCAAPRVQCGQVATCS